MLLSTAIETIEPHRAAVTGQTYELTGLSGSVPPARHLPLRGIYVKENEVNDHQLPQGFLVRQPPHSVTQPHFHATNQFQIFVGGSDQLIQVPAGQTFKSDDAAAGGGQYHVVGPAIDPSFVSVRNAG
ncbi:MAG: hypothetical protein GKR94_18685 [Gammaproteobacteria bacterium]|nr:hypothetical protein [Gammaproteobacteria bacterium]